MINYSIGCHSIFILSDKNAGYKIRLQRTPWMLTLCASRTYPQPQRVLGCRPTPKLPSLGQRAGIEPAPLCFQRNHQAVTRYTQSRPCLPAVNPLLQLPHQNVIIQDHSDAALNGFFSFPLCAQGLLPAWKHNNHVGQRA